jgi:hypothetical protein
MGVKMKKFLSFHGIITKIDDFWISANAEDLGCYKIFTVEDGRGSIVNFVVEPNTYFVDNAVVSVGDVITGFYDATAAVPLIFPPQYRAVVIALDNQFRNVTVDFFDSQLINSDNTLKLKLAPWTQIVIRNGQPFTRMPSNRNLIVIYGASTKSIPAQTTPYKIIVLC